jgi:hypothetical protein
MKVLIARSLTGLNIHFTDMPHPTGLLYHCARTPKFVIFFTIGSVVAAYLVYSAVWMTSLVKGVSVADEEDKASQQADC